MYSYILYLSQILSSRIHPRVSDLTPLIQITSSSPCIMYTSLTEITFSHAMHAFASQLSYRSFRPLQICNPPDKSRTLDLSAELYDEGPQPCTTWPSRGEATNARTQRTAARGG